MSPGASPAATLVTCGSAAPSASGNAFGRTLQTAGSGLRTRALTLPAYIPRDASTDVPSMVTSVHSER